MPAFINPFASGGEEGGGFTVDLPASTQAASHTVNSPGSAAAGWRFERPATVDRLQSFWSSHHYWGAPTGGSDGDDYEIKATKNSGSTPTGAAINTWLALSTTRSWQVNRSSLGTTSCNLTIEIRDAATQTVQDSQTYTMSATVWFA